MPPKKKGQTISLSAFFAETGGGVSSWADEMEALPTAPARREDTGPRRGEPGYLESMPDRSARTFSGAPQHREDAPLPDVPPFTAFVGNLTFETDEEEVRDFFASLDPISVRLVKDPQGKPKGFGYVEFPSKDNLRASLDLTGSNLAGRSVRINVADAPTSRPGGREYLPSQADESNQWRRATPLPAREPPAPRRNFSGVSNDGVERDWSSARGAKFTPSRESSGYGRPREPREPREVHHEPSAADEVDQWRSSRPLVTPAAPAERHGRDAPPHRPAGPAETESTWSRGTRVPSGPPAPQEPAGRQRLNLLPRSGGGSAAASPDSSPKPASSSPFGAARPIDTAAREREAEQHLAERRKVTADAAATKREADAARKEREARAAEQQQQRRPVRVHPSRLPPKETPEADADGFETVGGARRGAQQQQDAPSTSASAAKPATTKAGFSFAAAAGAIDEVADQLEETKV